MDTKIFGEELKRLGFCDFVGVPCSYLAPLINWAINENAFVMANNEGEAVAIASGISLVNLSLGNHCIDLAFSHKARTQSPLTLCQNAKNSTSTTANARILKELQGDSAKDSGDSMESIKIDCHANPYGLSRNDASLSSLRGSPQGLTKQSINENISAESRRSERAESLKDSNDSAESHKDSNIIDCHDLTSSSLAMTEKGDSAESRKFGVVLMQNSGLSNALSPLTSLNHTFEIPILGFVSLRGEPNERGENTDEPQHELLGRITHKILQTCEVECAFLDSNFEEACRQLQSAKATLESNKSFFFIVRSDCFEKVALMNNPLLDCHSHNGLNNGDSAVDSYDFAFAESHGTKPTRLSALQCLQNLAQNAALLATTGKCGRELYELDDRANQLYMVGSMGCVSSLALGIALKARKKIIAIDGDSALLMRLGTLSGNAFYANLANKGNFCHILLDNESHDSTGGQFNLSPFTDFCSIAKSCGYAKVIKASDLGEFERAIEAFLEVDSGGAWFIYLKIQKGSKKDLGRPKITPKQVALRFSAWINE